ncbi:hypothetical protein [Candidatus Palauibacter sp.]|uniref:hypothetical protein n=1 Tax=Candidatus Palauibacter sp. TaxID=3101350 RepID=UPI003AF2DDBA
MLELIGTAKELAGGTPHKPRQADLRCAVSAAYYALFHCLMRTCADSFIGTTGAHRSDAAWRQVYRALDHGSCKKRCAQVDKFGFPQPILDFANAIERLEGSQRRDKRAFAAFVLFARRA